MTRCRTWGSRRSGEAHSGLGSFNAPACSRSGPSRPETPFFQEKTHLISAAREARRSLKGLRIASRAAVNGARSGVAGSLAAGIGATKLAVIPNSEALQWADDVITRRVRGVTGAKLCQEIERLAQSFRDG